MQEDYREFEAKTVDEAIVAAMKAFHSDFEDLDIQIVSEGSKGLFGLVGAKSARILARPAGKQEKRSESAKPAPKAEKTAPAPAPAPVERPAALQQALPAEEMERACGIVRDILARMNIPCEVGARPENVIEITGDGSGLLIGKRGQTLDALQFITNRILNRNREEPAYVTVDTEGYRQRHLDHLRSLALRMGQKAKRTGQSVSLEKMNPSDRRIVHLALKNDTQVNTRSIGEGVYKKVLIVPKRASRS
jgi:spoIIIJ-associated protein